VLRPFQKTRPQDAKPLPRGKKPPAGVQTLKPPAIFIQASALSF